MSRAPMRGKRNTGGCRCFDCGNDSPITRAQEKHQLRTIIIEETEYEDEE